MPRPPLLSQPRMDKNKLLVVDVGNTATTWATFSTERTEHPDVLQSYTLSTKDLVGGRFRKSIKFKNMEHILISSVVPSVNRFLIRDCKKLFHKKPQFVSADSSSCIKVLYKKPKEVGADRLVNARAVVSIHSGPSIVIDFGTATTFDCISKKKEYLGGVIAPGPAISAEALHKKTAQLPLVELYQPVKILGQNTLESIRAGLYFGYRGLVVEIVRQLKKKLGPRTKVFSTGGQAHWILKGLPHVDKNYPHLTLWGLYFWWRDTQKFR